MSKIKKFTIFKEFLKFIEGTCSTFERARGTSTGEKSNHPQPNQLGESVTSPCALFDNIGQGGGAGYVSVHYSHFMANNIERLRKKLNDRSANMIWATSNSKFDPSKDWSDEDKITNKKLQNVIQIILYVLLNYNRQFLF